MDCLVNIWFLTDQTRGHVRASDRHGYSNQGRFGRDHPARRSATVASVQEQKNHLETLPRIINHLI